MAKNSSTEKESTFSFVLIIELCKNKYFECFYELFSDDTVLHLSAWYQC